MYKELIEAKKILERQEVELLEKIWNNKQGNSYLEELLKVVIEVKDINLALNTSMRSLTVSTRNYMLVSEMLVLLEKATGWGWYVDYVNKVSESGKPYIFICLRKEEVELESYSYEFLNFENGEGNFLEDFLVYDKIKDNEEFDFGFYLTLGRANIRKFLREDFDFSPHYPFLQESIQDKMMEEFKNIYSRSKKKTKHFN